MLASQAVGREFYLTAHEAFILSPRFSACWCRCRTGRKAVGCVENKVGMHVSLTCAVGEGGGVRSD